MNAKHENDDTNKRLFSNSPQENFFEIHVKGHLDESWRDWLGDLEVKLLDNGETVLSGYIKDQAALMGMLNSLHMLNLTLRSVNEVSQKSTNQEGTNQEI